MWTLCCLGHICDEKFHTGRGHRTISFNMPSFIKIHLQHFQLSCTQTESDWFTTVSGVCQACNACWHQTHLQQVWTGCLKELLADTGKNGVSFGLQLIFRSGFWRWCLCLCQAACTPHISTWDDGIRGCISQARGELAEDKSPSFGQQGGWTIVNYSSMVAVAEEFVYLGSNVDSTTQSISDIAMSQCHHIWMSRISTKLKLYNTWILPIFL